MLFCPTCANMLVISANDHGTNDWACQSCPYKFPIKHQVRVNFEVPKHYKTGPNYIYFIQMTSRTKLKRKVVDDVLGTQDFGTDETTGIYYSSSLPAPMNTFLTVCFGTVACPKCDHDRAFYRLIQIRSADEPMTRCEYPCLPSLKLFSMSSISLQVSPQ